MSLVPPFFSVCGFYGPCGKWFFPFVSLIAARLLSIFLFFARNSRAFVRSVVYEGASKCNTKQVWFISRRGFPLFTFIAVVVVQQNDSRIIIFFVGKIRSGSTVV